MKIIHVTIIIISTHYSFATIFVYNLWWAFLCLGLDCSCCTTAL